VENNNMSKKLTDGDKKNINKLKAGGMSAAVILSMFMLITPWEGSVMDNDGMHVAYVDKLGKGNPITYCNGLTGKDFRGNLPKAGDKYSQADCDYMMALRVKGFEQDVVTSVSEYNSPIAKVNNKFVSEYQKAAIISFAYNVGINNFRNSTLLRLLNAGKHGAACDELTKWVYVNGKILKGLINRRNQEYQWCMGVVDWKAGETLAFINENI